MRVGGNNWECGQVLGKFSDEFDVFTVAFITPQNTQKTLALGETPFGQLVLLYAAAAKLLYFAVGTDNDLGQLEL